MSLPQQVVREFKNRELLNDIDWVTVTLYQYQQDQVEPSAETTQDCIWTALRINSDPRNWGITHQQYESSSSSWRSKRRMRR